MRLALFQNAASADVLPGLITQDGEVIDFEIQHIGRMQLNVVDPLKRAWEKGVYMGADSTNPDAIRRNRPQTPH